MNSFSWVYSNLKIIFVHNLQILQVFSFVLKTANIEFRLIGNTLANIGQMLPSTALITALLWPVDIEWFSKILLESMKNILKLPIRISSTALFLSYTVVHSCTRLDPTALFFKTTPLLMVENVPLERNLDIFEQHRSQIWAIIYENLTLNSFSLKSIASFLSHSQMALLHEPGSFKHSMCFCWVTGSMKPRNLYDREVPSQLVWLFPITKSRLMQL